MNAVRIAEYSAAYGKVRRKLRDASLYLTHENEESIEAVIPIFDHFSIHF
jgi:hypothetical protein